MIGRRKNANIPALEQTRRSRRARVVRSSIGSNTIKSTERAPRPPKKNYILYRIAAFIFVASIIFWSGYTGGVYVANPKEGESLDESVEATVRDYFSGTQRWWWFVSVNDAIATIKKENPYVQDVSIRRDLSRDIVVEVQQRTPAIRLIANKRQYLVANDGVILEASEGGSKLPLVYDESSDVTDASEGKPYLPEQTVSTIQEIKHSLSGSEFNVKDFSLTDNTREVRVYLDDLKYFIKFTTDADVDSQISALRSVKDKLKGVKDYVDIRFSGKVYIR